MTYYDVIPFIYGPSGVRCAQSTYRLSSDWIAMHVRTRLYGCYLFSSAVIS